MTLRHREWMLPGLGALLLAVAAGPGAPAATRPEAAQAEPFALLELFTSEGCSSCPPADRLLAQVAARAYPHGRRVLALEFHVDYWNHLGWSDPFSSAAWSQRQERYAEALGTSQVYTPQLIVNGLEQCVGSDRGRAESAIAAALARPAPVSLEFQAAVRGHGCEVAYRVSAAPRGALLCFALVDPEHVTHVGAGENAGRTLVHTNVVRELASVPLGDQLAGRVSLRWAGLRPAAQQRVVGFVQDSATLAVLGAASGPLTPGDPN